MCGATALSPVYVMVGFVLKKLRLMVRGLKAFVSSATKYA